MLFLKKIDFPTLKFLPKTEKEIKEPDKKIEKIRCMEEVLPRRNMNLQKDKCYIRVYKPETKSLMISIYIGTDIIKLLEIDVLRRITVYCSRENKNIIELEQNNSNSGYKISFKNSSNCLVVTFSCPNYLAFHPMNTKEVEFNFTNKPSIIFDITRINQ